jgi:hypothetical protein
MTKYAPLRDFLEKQNRKLVPMSFADIEKLIGTSLPASARKHRPWWSNNPSNSVITHAWLAAGYRTEQVDMERGKLVFRRLDDAPSGNELSLVRNDEKQEKPYHPLFGAMKGLIRVAPGVDLTEPADPDWGKAYD